MAFSNTVGQTTFNTRKVIDRAFGRCKVTPQRISAEYIDIAKDALFLMLSEWSNAGAPLWCIEKTIYPLYDGVAQVTTALGTVDLREVNLRMLQEATGTNTDAAASRTVEFTDDTIVMTVGIKWSGASVPLALERSDDGAAWTTIQTETDPAAVSGDWTWFDLESVVAASYFRVRATSGSLAFEQIYLGNTPTEIPVYRMNRTEYTSLPNKTSKSSRPTQYYLERDSRQPVMQLWPMPDSSAETNQLIVWRQRHIMDVGNLTQEVEVPQRWYNAVVAGLACRLALDVAEVDMQMHMLLKPLADEALSLAYEEERDKGTFSLAPAIGMYTA